MGHLEEMAMYERIHAEMDGDFGDLAGIEGPASAGEFGLAIQSAIEAAWELKRPLSRELLDDIRAEDPFDNPVIRELMLQFLDEIPVKDA
ncbi:hypothetical protein [Rhodococcus marinonascens]|uniref:hypothetical protein n=1 Tax=Rhodococcus marinonascens TaxID=38311 RepID=UPI000A6B11C9|nr:hypothetical protein [Rhodococcus marinonascens]